MIELEIQFKIVIVSIVYGMIFTNLYTFIEKMLGKSKVFKKLNKPNASKRKKPPLYKIFL